MIHSKYTHTFGWQSSLRATEIAVCIFLAAHSRHRNLLLSCLSPLSCHLPCNNTHAFVLSLSLSLSLYIHTYTYVNIHAQGKTNVYGSCLCDSHKHVHGTLKSASKLIFAAFTYMSIHTQTHIHILCMCTHTMYACIHDM